MKILGWTACLVLAGSLIYAFIDSLVAGSHTVDPWFFACQTLASLLFLLYSLKVRNRIFVAANAVALVSAIATVLVGVAG